ncbi:hypothetical protein [Amycolatopsis sp. BJA-103]|uniref:hypothetical protein n=1 Tax=unclassified Amycolatopsis TaxID=2618356 RepID=UPI000C786A70|nr:hypothetical protein [Amycolatopsis sp. BJA-103]AUI61008.1 hypothetical protein BKN51_24335 [Amycolatopsis sp. BJA-103]PNE21706.1 hypothetical protein B1H26_08145 [Amycolatopsis sp. BJA-103]
MTFDIIGLCADRPDPATALESVLPLNGGLTASTVEGGPVVQLRHPDGRLLVSIEDPRLVRVPGEARRLLGVEIEVPHPVWWVESRAPDEDPEAEAVARAFTEALVGGTGGLSWSSR